MRSPLDEISREGLFDEIPVLVDHGRHLHRVLRREDCGLKDATGVDEYLPSQGVDVHCVAVMGSEKLVDGVEDTQVPIRRDDERLHCRMGV